MKPETPTVPTTKLRINSAERRIEVVEEPILLDGSSIPLVILKQGGQ